MSSKKLSYTTLTCAVTLVLAGCAGPSSIKYKPSPLEGLKSTQQESSSAVEVDQQDYVKVVNGPQYLSAMKSENPISAQEQLKQQQYQFEMSEQVKLAVENMPIRDFLHYVFGELLEVNYVLDEAAIDNQQTVSLKIEQSISADELFELVADLLKEKNIRVQLKQKVFYVFSGVSNQETKDILLGLGSKTSDVPVGSENVLQLVPLKYTSFNRIARVMVNLVTAEIYSESDSSGLSIKGKRTEVVKALNLLSLLDQPSTRSQYVAIYPLVFLSPKSFVTQMTKLLTEDGFSVSNGVKFTPIDHLNSVIVHASNQILLDRMEMWKLQLDKASDTTEKQFFVFYPKLANAVTLGDSLSNILALQTGGAIAPARPEQSRTANNERANQTRGGGRQGIAIDEQRNALIFYMEPKEYQSIYPMLQQLDVLPKQVIIEATLMEVTLTDKLSYGVEWFIKNSVDKFGTQGGIGDLPAGFQFTLDKPGFDLVMSALASTNQVNIVSNPKLMVTNGEAATLNVGSEIPTITSTVANATEGSGQVLQSVQYRNTGITLTVTPNVNSRNFVELQIDQQLSEAGENELSGIDSPIVLKRDIQTKVLVEDGQTLILAGLISENNSGKDTKVPLLGDIPVIGELFKNTSNTTVKTEMLLMITPKVVNDPTDVSKIKKAIGSNFKHIDLQTNF